MRSFLRRYQDLSLDVQPHAEIGSIPPVHQAGKPDHHKDALPHNLSGSALLIAGQACTFSVKLMTGIVASKRDVITTNNYANRLDVIVNAVKQTSGKSPSKDCHVVNSAQIQAIESMLRTIGSFRPCLISLLMLLSFTTFAQISPGDLTDAHKELEGMGNCTECHVLGERLPSTAKCLACHEDIQSLMDANHGYHASIEVVDKECVVCHSEHHGREFDMMRFDQDNFDHDLTGYILEGGHLGIDCRECHQPDYILDSEIAARENTFLGLEEDCKTCHEDYHQNTLGDDCASCHNFEDFRPAPGFDHDDSEYPLVGAHIEVDCIECHAMTTLNGKEFQEFTDLEFNDCVSCHEDPHDSQLAGTCTQCHNEEAFTSFVGDTGFDHNTTDFELKGKHQEVSCFECHQNTSEPLIVFQDHLGVGQSECIACHEDIHEGRFGDNCAECHNEENWLMAGVLDDFNHDLTSYPLVGMHVAIDCKECHTTEKYTDPLAFDNCFDCHDDYHEGEFMVKNTQTNCVECHSLEVGFEETLYTIEQHQDTNFPLEGAHLATPCSACHLPDEEPAHWTFRNLGADCIDCHDDIHRGQFAEAGTTDCTTCHGSEDWFPHLFDHDNTAFALEGRHAEVECAACHLPTEKGETFVEYQIPKFECVDCHSL